MNWPFLAIRRYFCFALVNSIFACQCSCRSNKSEMDYLEQSVSSLLRSMRELESRTTRKMQVDMPILAEQTLTLPTAVMERLEGYPFLLNKKQRENIKLNTGMCFVPTNRPYRASDSDDGNSVSTLVPIEMTSNGEEFIDALKTDIAKGRAHCEGENKCRISYYANEQSDSERKFILRCNFHRTANSTGAPENCEVITAQDNDGILVKAVIAKTKCRLAGSMQPSDSQSDLTRKSFDVDLKKLIIWSAVIAAIEDGLQTSPLSLGTNVEDESFHATISASASHRVSKILTGNWREQVTARIDVYNGILRHEHVHSKLENQEKDKDSTAETSGKIKISMYINLWVSKYNTEERSYWHMPSLMQEKIYVDKIRERLNSELQRTCKKTAKIQIVLQGKPVRCPP